MVRFISIAVFFFVFLSIVPYVFVPCALAQSETSLDNDSIKSVAVVYLHGEVDYALARFTERSIAYAKENNAEAIIFDIDTFGGRVDSALEISRAITDLTTIQTIAYVTVKAISAGALIALSCNKIVMRSGTTIGDCAPIAITQEGPQMLGEKFQSPLRAEFRKLAERNGYPVALAESMVSSDIEVVKVAYVDGYYEYMTRKQFEEFTAEENKRVYKAVTLVDEEELLTIHDQEALEFGFASKVVDNEEELFDYFHFNSHRVVRVKFLWSEQLVRFLDRIAPILMLIGMLALYTEFKVPGFGLPGIVGLACFALLFGSKYLIGLASYLEIILFCVGIILILLEIFVIPGFGITGIAGFICIILSFYLSSQSFVIPRMPWEIAIAKNWMTQFSVTLLSFFLISFFLAKYLPHSFFAKRVMLQTTLSREAGISALSKDYTAYLGKEGVAVSMLRPSGRAQIAKDVVTVVSDCGFIESGTPLIVIRVEGTKIYVQKSTGENVLS
ncbi:serine protease [bacterium]|nr:serine protease [bacterium]